VVISDLDFKGPCSVPRRSDRDIYWSGLIEYELKSTIDRLKPHVMPLKPCYQFGCVSIETNEKDNVARPKLAVLMARRLGTKSEKDPACTVVRRLLNSNAETMRIGWNVTK
jgi:hypothetical protein